MEEEDEEEEEEEEERAEEEKEGRQVGENINLDDRAVGEDAEEEEEEEELGVLNGMYVRPLHRPNGLDGAGEEGGWADGGDGMREGGEKV